MRLIHRFAIALLLSAATSLAAAQGVVEQWYSAEQVPVPAGATCTRQLVPDQRVAGSRTQSHRHTLALSLPQAAACPGPWSRVVAHVSARMPAGVGTSSARLQAGGITLGSFTIPASGRGNAVAWSTDIDITDYLALLRQPGQMRLVFDLAGTTKASDIHADVAIRFHPATSARPAAAAAHALIPLLDTVLTTAQPRIALASIPVNTTRLAAVLRTRGRGHCEPQWWSAVAAPYASDTCATTSVRELALYVDGRLAGLATPFPVMPATGTQSRWWTPLLAPRTLVETAWTLDITPFVGLLTDGKPHAFAIGLRSGMPQAGEGIAVDLHLQARTARSAGRTTGALVYARAGSEPSIQSQDDVRAYHVQVADLFEASGWLRTADGVSTSTSVSQAIGTRFEQRDAGRMLRNRHDYRQRVNRTVTDDAGQTTVIRNEEHSSAIVNRMPDGWDITDTSRQTITVNGNQVFRLQRKDSMDSLLDADGSMQASRDWSHADSSGLCASNRLVTRNGRLLQQRPGQQCIW